MFSFRPTLTIALWLLSFCGIFSQELWRMPVHMYSSKSVDSQGNVIVGHLSWHMDTVFFFKVNGSDGSLTWKSQAKGFASVPSYGSWSSVMTDEQGDAYMLATFTNYSISFERNRSILVGCDGRSGQVKWSKMLDTLVNWSLLSVAGELRIARQNYGSNDGVTVKINKSNGALLGEEPLPPLVFNPIWPEVAASDAAANTYTFGPKGIVKKDAGGKPCWKHPFPIAVRQCIFNDGNIYLAAALTWTEVAIFNSAAGSYTVKGKAGQNQYTYVLIKLDAGTGLIRWVKGYEQREIIKLGQLFLDPAGNLLGYGDVARGDANNKTFFFAFDKATGNVSNIGQLDGDFGEPVWYTAEDIFCLGSTRFNSGERYLLKYRLPPERPYLLMPAASVQVGPNPFDESMIVYLDKSYTEPYTIEITDLAGKKILSLAGLTQLQYLNLSELEPGIYTLTITGEDGTKTIKRIVKDLRHN